MRICLPGLLYFYSQQTDRFKDSGLWNQNNAGKYFQLLSLTYISTYTLILKIDLTLSHLKCQSVDSAQRFGVAVILLLKPKVNRLQQIMSAQRFFLRVNTQLSSTLLKHKNVFNIQHLSWEQD